jgi:hypothetical protein
MPALRSRTCQLCLALLVVAASAAPTLAQTKCKAVCASDGLCRAKGKRCVATSKKHCRASQACRVDGRCSLKRGACVVRSTRSCAASKGCLEQGRCNLVVDRCEPLIEPDCSRSVGCMANARCSLVDTTCQVASDADCALSNRCKLRGKCTYHSGRCIIGRNLDRRASASSGGGFVSGVTFGGLIVAGVPDPNIYAGVGARLGWALNGITVFLTGELYLPGTFTTPRVVNAINSSLTVRQFEVEQGVRSSLSRFGASANYYFLGGHREAFSIYTIGGLGMMNYALAFDVVPHRSGYETLSNDPMAMSLVQLDAGLGLEVRGGPVHAVVDFRLGLPVAGGVVGTVDAARPITMSLHAGIRIGL